MPSKQILRQKRQLESDLLKEIKDADLVTRLRLPFLQILEEPAWVPALIQIKKMFVQNQQLSSYEKEK